MTADNLSVSSKSVRPRILEYLDFRAFMRDFYNFKKSQSASFSFTIWSERAGFKSRSYLRLVMLGQRALGADSISRVAHALELRKPEQRYFESLVALAQAKTVSERERHLRDVLKSSQASQAEQVKNSYVFLSNHHTPKVLSHLVMSDLEQTPKAIAGALRLDEPLVHEVLAVLKNMHLAEPIEDTQTWRATVKQAQVADDYGNLALQAFHRRTLEEAQAALTQVVPQERHFEAFTLTLSDQQYESCVKEIKDFIRYLQASFKTEKADGRKIYQISLQAIPVSDRLIRTAKTVCAQECKLNPGEQIEGVSI